MSNAKEAGTFQLDNGFWCFRYKILIDGKEHTMRKTKDEKAKL